MRIPAIVLILGVSCLLLSACGGSNESSASPAPTSTIGLPPPPAPAATPVPGAQQPPPPQGGGRTVPVIGPENARSLLVASQVVVADVQRFVWSENGDRVYIVTKPAVYRLDTGSNDASALYTADPGEEVLAVSRDGVVAVASQDRVSLSIYSSQGRHIQTLEAGPYGMADFSPNGDVIAVSHRNRVEVELWDVASSTRVDTLSGFETAAAVYSAHFTPDGASIAWLSRGKLQLQNIAGGMFGPPIEHEDLVAAFDVAPKAGLIATAAGNRLALWDAAGARRGVLADATLLATGLSFSPDGRLLAGGTADSLQLWDVTAQTRLDAIAGKTTVVSFSPDGKSLAIVHADGVQILQASEE
jgi:WD40 repeat protein